ncbi:MAG TPA: 30S ribosomal protein S20 [Candidatus Binatia bacterium]|nr:30S ribosomal protein S20 [Candidatus Binatia bacterium]
MARIQSSVKDIRRTKKRHAVNTARRSQLRSQLKKLRGLLAKKDATSAKRELTRTVSILDRSVSHGILHRNTAARHKSRLTRQVNALGGR